MPTLPPDLREKLEDLFAIDRRSLTLLRVSLGSLLLVDLAMRARNLQAHYTDGGVFPRAAAIFGSKQPTPEAKATTASTALHAEETAALEPTPSSALTVERRGHTATRLANGRVLIAGGENASGVLNQTEIYDLTADTFTAAGNLNSGARR